MNNIKKQLAAILTAILIVISLCGCQISVFPTMIRELDSDGGAILNTTLYDMNSWGLNIGDSVKVTIGEFSDTMIIVDTVIEEDGKLQILNDNREGTLSIIVYNGDFVETYGISVGDIVKIEKQ